jgi:hypothetical protein
MVRPKPRRAQPTDSNRGSQRLTFATTGTVLQRAADHGHARAVMVTRRLLARQSPVGICAGQSTRN